jgi:UDP-glucose:(heptosyl)LPS alpha-1,3-glucosyltransferase
MKLAFCLYKHFPYSGLSRDMLRIARACVARGHEITIFTGDWQDTPQPGMTVEVLRPVGLTNHSLARSFQRRLRRALASRRFDAVVGFNKMAGLDLYYGADFCYVGRTKPRQHWAYRLTPRYRFFYRFENAVFNARNRTHILALSAREQSVYQEYYLTPDHRFHALPPTLDAARRLRGDRQCVRSETRASLGLADREHLLLFVGSGFKTKGLDRVIEALAALPESLRQHTRLAVIGQDREDTFRALAQNRGVSGQVSFLGGRDDVPALMCAADLLVHPARGENTGTVLLEAIAAGLPVLATDVCGYAPHIRRAGAGRVLPSPFEQGNFNRLVREMLVAPERAQWIANGLAYGLSPDLYRMPEAAADFIEQWVSDHNRALARAPAQEGVQMYLRQDLRAALGPDVGFEDIMAISGQVFREAPGRRTVRFEREGKRYFLKSHTGVGWQEIMKNLFYLRAPVIGAVTEWHGIHRLKLLGVDTLRIAGFGLTGRNPARRRSFIITDELPPSVSLENYFRTWRARPRHGPADVRCKRWLIRKVAQTARTLHINGANHRDFYLCHFMLQLPREDAAPDPDSAHLYLIDLHRMQLRRRTPLRWLVKDIAGLYYSAMDFGFTRHDLYRFMREYRNTTLRATLHDDARMWRRVLQRARALYASEREKPETRSGPIPAAPAPTLGGR